MGTNVPSNKFKDRPELPFCHRLIYRTRVDVPAELAGRSFVFQFPAVSLMATLFVNGQCCGFTKAPFALWECDATAAIKPGQVNEVCVVIKDSYYAVSWGGRPGACRSSFTTPVDAMSQSWMQGGFDFPIGSGVFEIATSSGILLTPSLVVAGPVYTSDVFAIPSVKNKTLGLEITVTNPTPQAQQVQLLNEVVPLTGGSAEKVFAPRPLVVAAGKEQIVKLAEPWANPKLWWPDDPQMYRVVTKIVLGGKVVDVRRTSFGFRQWEWDSPQFKLNGLPWNLRGDTAAGVDGFSQGTVQETVDYFRQSGQNHIRYWNPLGSAGQQKSQVLDSLDAHGVIVRRDGIMDGMGCNYMGNLGGNEALFENWIPQLKAMVKEERNHPSIFAWSMENELTLINARNFGLLKQVEPRITRAAQAVMALDPTRPAMIDGGNCLSTQTLPVNNGHYIESSITEPGIPLRDYPDQAYTWEKIVENEKKVFPLALDRPILLGECFFMSGWTPGQLAEFGGEGCFAGAGPYTQRGGGLYAKMMTEGFRWHGIAGWEFSFSGGQAGNMHFNSQKPVALFCRQWNWTLGGGSEVRRTLKLFNDTRFADPIEAAWELRLDGRRVVGQVQSFALAACEHREFDVTVKVPQVPHRTAGEFILTCTRGGKEVFREVKPVSVLDPNGGPRPSLGKSDLVVLDPLGSVKHRLQARGIAFTEAASAAEIPDPQAGAPAKVVIVGKDALSACEATDPQWTALAGNGAKVLVLDQAHPLHYQATPSDLAPTDFVGRVAFEENTEHPIFAGLEQSDFFTWSQDHVVYRNVYTKPTRGATSLAHCDKELNYSAIAECPVNDGLLLLCQMVVGEKLAFDPVAERLFDNMLAYCARYVPERRATAVVMAEGSPALKMLHELGLKFDPAADALSAVSGGKHQVVIFDATPTALESLAGNLGKVRAFTEKGGWLMAWGLTPDGLASFNKLVGVQHVLRPFELELVSLPAQRDPLLSGLTVRDVALESTEQIFGWAATKFMVDDEFTWIVDFDDIAPFCEFANAKAGDHAAARKAQANWPRNVVNGFLDIWILNYYCDTASPKVPLKLPRPERINHFAIVLNTDYAKARKVNLYFDDDPKPVALTTKADHSRQEFDLVPREASRLVIELADFDKPANISGIDKIWIGVERSAEWRQKVKPLANVGGLVKYPMGSGGILLNQVLVKPAEANPVNAQKKRNIVAALLHNLHATFAGSKILTAANLKCRPLPLDERCNQFLSKDRGWFGDDKQRDLAHVPVGANNLAGVPYTIRDHRTSPVPSCVMLAGPGAKGQLPKEVKGLRVGGKADVLFFLHTFNRTAPWQPAKPGDQPPAVFKYVVHYADGQTAEIPVLYGEGADHWLAKEPKGLKSASVAWAAPVPGDASAEQAVLYQLSWTNPRPTVSIDSLDMLYGPDGSKYGTPALLAITAGEEVR
jgi:beta-galactosidase